jgi:hypothetical protein
MRDASFETALSDANLADYAAIDPIYVDGVAGVFNLGVNFGTMLFRWVPVRSEGGGLTYESVLVQPRTSLLCGKSCRVNTILDAQGLPTASSSHAAGSQSFN